MVADRKADGSPVLKSSGMLLRRAGGGH